MAHIFTYDSPVCILGTVKRVDNKGRPFYTFYYKSDNDTFNCVWFRCPVELKETSKMVDANGKPLKGAFQWALDMKATLTKKKSGGNTYYNVRIVSATIVDDLKMPKPSQKEKWQKAIDKYKPKLPEKPEEPLGEPIDIDTFVAPMEEPKQELVDVDVELPPLKEKIL